MSTPYAFLVGATASIAAAPVMAQGSMIGGSLELRAFIEDASPCADVDVFQGSRVIGDGPEWTNLVDAAGVDIISVFIDVGAADITFDYSPAGFGNFCAGVENTYVFRDLDGSIPSVLNVSIDQDATTLGIDPDDIDFSENELRMNVEGLSYSPASYVRLVIELGPDACPADVNGDGVLAPNDFASWIQAFNTQAPACDQNGDGLCLSNDFASWIQNYNAGCP